MTKSTDNRPTDDRVCSECRHWSQTTISAGDGYFWGKCNARATLFREPHSGFAACCLFEEREVDDGEIL